MKGKKKYYFSILLFILLFVLTFYYIFSQYPIPTFLEIIKKCNYYLIFLAFIMVFSYLFFEALFFRILFKQLEIHITWWQAFSYVATEVYFSAVTPSSTGGQPVQMFYMARDEIPYKKSAIVVLINTILYKFAIIILGIIGIFIFPKLMLQNGVVFNILMLFGIVCNILVIVFFAALLYSKKLPKKVLKLLFRIVRFFHLMKPEKLKQREDGLEESLTEYHDCASFTKKNVKFMSKLFLYIFLQRISIFVISYIIYRAFGLSGYSLLEIMALQIGVTLAMDSVPFPGGVMVGETMTYQVNLLIYGVVFAMSSMILLRGISFYFLVFVSGILFAVYHFFGKKKVVVLDDRNL